MCGPIHDERDLESPGREVFNFMADMRNAPRGTLAWRAREDQRWSRRLGTVYRVNVIFLGRTMPLDYSGCRL